MAEQSTITLSGLPGEGDNITATDGQATALTQIVDEFNKQVPLTKISADQAWTVYSVTWTGASSNPAIGNGTLTGRYRRMGRDIYGVIYLTPGTTTTYGSGLWSFSLPVTATNSSVEFPSTALALDSGTQWYVMVSRVQEGATTVQVINNGNTGTGINSTTPFTWTNGDELFIQFHYEAAS